MKISQHITLKDLLNDVHLLHLILVHHFESVAQAAHVGVLVFEQFVPFIHDLDGQSIDASRLAGLEEQPEVAWVFGVDAESIS